MTGILFWGIKCKGCGAMHPVVMVRPGDDKSLFIKPDEKLSYRCPEDNKRYGYVGKEQQKFELASAAIS